MLCRVLCLHEEEEGEEGGGGGGGGRKRRRRRAHTALPSHSLIPDGNGFTACTTAVVVPAYCRLPDIVPVESLGTDDGVITSVVLRGTILNRTYGTHNNLPGTWYMFRYFYYQFSVVFAVVPRKSVRK